MNEGLVRQHDASCWVDYLYALQEHMHNNSQNPFCMYIRPGGAVNSNGMRVGAFGHKRALSTLARSGISCNKKSLASVSIIIIVIPS